MRQKLEQVFAVRPCVNSKRQIHAHRLRVCRRTCPTVPAEVRHHPASRQPRHRRDTLSRFANEVGEGGEGHQLAVGESISATWSCRTSCNPVKHHDKGSLGSLIWCSKLGIGSARLLHAPAWAPDRFGSGHPRRQWPSSRAPMRPAFCDSRSECSHAVIGAPGHEAKKRAAAAANLVPFLAARCGVPALIVKR